MPALKKSGRSTVLVTGGAGFIGSELVRQLATRGDRVRIVDNLVSGSSDNIAPFLSSDVTLHVADVRDRAAIRPLLRGVAAVYHLACLGVRHSVHSPVENHEVNATGTLGLLEMARAADVPRFVYVSSSEVYGTARWAPMTEEHPTFPRTVYGASKLGGECYARAFHSTYDYPTTVVRPFNTYGPRSHHSGDRGEVIPKFLLRALAGRPLVVFGDGRQTRDFTYVTDTAAGIIGAGEHPETVGATVNLGSGIEVSINMLAEMIARLTRRRGLRVEHDVARPGDVGRLCADVSKAAGLFGYRTTVSLEQGLRRTLAWYARQPATAEELLRSEIVRNWLPTGTSSVAPIPATT